VKGGWWLESNRHSLARKGIKTAIKPTKTFYTDLKGAYGNLTSHFESHLPHPEENETTEQYIKRLIDVHGIEEKVLQAVHPTIKEGETQQDFNKRLRRALIITLGAVAAGTAAAGIIIAPREAAALASRESLAEIGAAAEAIPISFLSPTSPPSLVFDYLNKHGAITNLEKDLQHKLHLGAMT
jgi:hypothetical protein